MPQGSILDPLLFLILFNDAVAVPNHSKIYHSMILPTFNYCGTLQLYTIKIQFCKLASFHSRVLKIVSGGESAIQQSAPIVKANKARACKLVRKSLDKDTCWQLENYFTLLQHEKQIRNNQFKLMLPKIKNRICKKLSYVCGSQGVQRTATGAPKN